MIYQGSKRRIAKDIIPIMLKEVKDENTIFYDVFLFHNEIFYAIII